MNVLTLSLLDGQSEQRLNDVASLVATDASGQFGVLPGHEPMVTALEPGLIRCRLADGSTRHLACTGGAFSCRDNAVQVVASRFLMSEREEQLAEQLDRLLSREHATQIADRQSRAEIERALVKRLREWSQAGPG